MSKTNESMTLVMEAHDDAKPVLPVAKSELKFAETLMRLEPMLDGRAVKLVYTGVNRERIPVKAFALVDPSNRSIIWKWDSTLAHEILRGRPTTVQPAFMAAIKQALADRQQVAKPKSKVEQAIALMRSMSAKDRQAVLDGLTPVGTKLAAVPDTTTRVGRRLAKDMADKVAKKVLKDATSKNSFPAPKDDSGMKARKANARTKSATS